MNIIRKTFDDSRLYRHLEIGSTYWLRSVIDELNNTHTAPIVLYDGSVLSRSVSHGYLYVQLIVEV